FTFGRDGQRIAFAIPGQTVGVWRISKPAGYRLLQGVVGDTATVWFQDVSLDGRWAVWTPPQWMNRPGFELFDLASNRPALFVPTNRTVRVGFHPLEPKVVVASREGVRAFQITNAPDGRLRLASGAGTSPPRGCSPRHLPLR